MEWQPRRLAAHPSQPGMQYSGPPYWAPAMQYVQPWHPAQFGAPWEQMQGWHPAAPSAQFAQSSHVASPSEQLRRERVLDKTYCLIDKDGSLRPFSSVSEISGQNYEQMISTICCSGGPRILRAIVHQQDEERIRLAACKQAVADSLQSVFDHGGPEMRARGGVGEMEAEIDTFYNGSFKEFAEHINQLGTVKVSATCANVAKVLVEVCSDSRFVARKLYQIEIQSCLVQREGFLVRDDPHNLESVQLDVETTGYAIIYNRAALQIETEALARKLGLSNVLGLLKQQRLHIVYFQSEAVLPAALHKARQAADEAKLATQKAEMALQVAQGSAAPAQPTVVWACQLRKDGSTIEVAGSAFKVKGTIADVDDLKKAIKNENPKTVTCDAFQLDIYSQQDRNWVKEDEANELNRGTSKQDCYGFTLPQKTDDV